MDEKERMKIQTAIRRVVWYTNQGGGPGKVDRKDKCRERKFERGSHKR